MDDDDIAAWARIIAAELRVAGEPGFIDRVIGRHLETLKLLKESVGWKGVANILKRAGARREDGISPLSEDQLRTSYRRMRLRSEEVVHKAPKTREASSRAQPRAARARSKSASGRVSPQAQTQIRTDHLSKDVSDSEVASALSRITKIGSRPFRRKP
jgi:hypothetical protein